MNRAGWLAIACLALAAAACDKAPREAPPALPPVIPPPQQQNVRPPVVLVEPEEAPRPVEPEPTEPVPTSPPTVHIDMGELGQHDLITWDEAKRRAEAQITPENADQDLARMRNEIQLRTRRP